VIFDFIIAGNNC